MKPAYGKIDLTVSFKERAQMGRFLKGLSSTPRLDATLVRSRMTPFGGWVSVTLSGSLAAIDAFLNAWEGPGMEQASHRSLVLS